MMHCCHLVFPCASPAPLAVQVMFGYLQESEKKFLDTSSMCRACKDAGGQPVDPLEQQVTCVDPFGSGV